MKILYDAITGKDIRYGVAIAQRLRGKGYKVVLTTREHPDTLPLAEYLGEKMNVIGSYGGRQLRHKLLESAKRIKELTEFVEREKFDLAISHGSVEMCRVAYEFDIPIICTWDTIHADKVAKLTLSITNHVVVSMAVPVTRLRKFGVSHKSIHVFNGVDEVAWLYQAKKDYVVKNGRPLIVYRGLETSAAYVSSKLIDEEKIIASLRRFGRVLRLRRQSTKFVDALSLVGVADLFVGYGGTITREAVLQGTPAVVIETSAIEQHMNKFMAKKGFPVYFVNPNEQDISEFVDEKVDIKRQNTSDLVLKLDDPIDVIEEIVEGYS